MSNTVVAGTHTAWQPTLANLIRIRVSGRTANFCRTEQASGVDQSADLREPIGEAVAFRRLHRPRRLNQALQRNINSDRCC
jgi:hypothetical protein